VDLHHWESLFTPRTRLSAFTHASNVLGAINPVREMAKIAHRNGALVLVDAAQSVPHLPVDMVTLGADLVVFSAHKMLGPTGVGVLAADATMLGTWGPFNTGGSMIREVKPDGATWNDVPWRFEAGTPDIGGVIAFGAALEYLQELGMDNIRAHEIDLTRYALEHLRTLPSLTLLGPTDPLKRTGVISFIDADLHPHDLATVLDREGVAIRAGHHCAQPLMRELNVVATSRASLYLYNDRDDVDSLVDGIKTARRYFKLP
jgi:cysteine desulfurase/selenocysteine lyase